MPASRGQWALMENVSTFSDVHSGSRSYSNLRVVKVRHVVKGVVKTVDDGNGAKKPVELRGRKVWTVGDDIAPEVGRRFALAFNKPVYFATIDVAKKALTMDGPIDTAKPYETLGNDDVTEHVGFLPNKQRTRRNPEVHRKLAPNVMSESNALQMMRQLAADIQHGTLKDAKDNAATIVAYCDELIGQIAKGVHANPSLTTFMANPGKLMSRDVQLIVYRHVEDDEFYAHQFGGKDVRFKVIRGRQVVDLTTLPRRTGVDMRTNGRTVTLSRPDGKPMSEDF
jgi:hypothetical protein